MLGGRPLIESGLYWRAYGSLFRALIHEGFALSIWFGQYKLFLKSLTRSGHTDKPKSTRKYLSNDKVSLQQGENCGYFVIGHFFVSSLYKNHVIKYIWFSNIIVMQNMRHRYAEKKQKLQVANHPYPQVSWVPKFHLQLSIHVKGLEGF